MRVKYPGLICELLPSGNPRWRVRKEGDPKVRITLRVAPDHPRFNEHYYAARMGIQLDPEPETPRAIRGSVGWLVESYINAMEQMQDDGQLGSSTVQQRSQFLEWLKAEVGKYRADMPQVELIRLRDLKAAKPGAADNFVKAVRAMYIWSIQQNFVQENPAIGINKINRGTGATAWTLDDLKVYREKHPAGTMAHLALTLFMFTACRIGDVYRLGRHNEIQRRGTTWLAWQPEKKGSSRVEIPMMPPLLSAIREQSIVGPTYLLTQHGKPFASKNAFGNKFSDWIADAGLSGLSSHGIRKAAGELLALHGASQYHIMAVHGHSSAKTSEIYTRGADRARLAEQAMQKLDGMEW